MEDKMLDGNDFSDPHFRGLRGGMGVHVGGMSGYTINGLLTPTPQSESQSPGLLHGLTPLKYGECVRPFDPGVRVWSKAVASVVR